MKNLRMLKSKNVALVLAGFALLIVSGCGLTRQANEMTQLSKCDFKIQSVENLMLAGVNIQQIKSYSDLKFSDMLKVTSAVTGGALPLDFILHIQGRNPNTNQAAMNRLEWIAFIDDNEMANGALNERFEIPGNGGISDIPLSIHIDLLKALSGKSTDALMNFAFNLSGIGGKPTRIKVKAKPTIFIGSRAIEYPGYITIRQDFGAK
jgi:hypothetical protein